MKMKKIEKQKTNFFRHFRPFLPFYRTLLSPNDPKNQNFEKGTEKMPGDFILLDIPVYHK